MKLTPSNKAVLALIPLILSANLANPIANSASIAPYLPSAICRIEIDNAHISTTMNKYQLGKFVKINARSVCNVSQSQVKLTLEIYKTGRFGSIFIAKFQTMPSDIGSVGLIVKINGALVTCKNNKKTTYFGIAYSKAMIAGSWQYAGRTRSPLNISLNCGT
jgi:hypothetical protein